MVNIIKEVVVNLEAKVENMPEKIHYHISEEREEREEREEPEDNPSNTIYK